MLSHLHIVEVLAVKGGGGKMWTVHSLLLIHIGILWTTGEKIRLLFLKKHPEYVVVGRYSLLLHGPRPRAKIAFCVEGENLADMVRYTFHLPIRPVHPHKLTSSRADGKQGSIITLLALVRIFWRISLLHKLAVLTIVLLISTYWTKIHCAIMQISWGGRTLIL